MTMPLPSCRSWVAVIRAAACSELSTRVGAGHPEVPLKNAGK